MKTSSGALSLSLIPSTGKEPQLDRSVQHHQYEPTSLPRYHERSYEYVHSTIRHSKRGAHCVLETGCLWQDGVFTDHAAEMPGSLGRPSTKHPSLGSRGIPACIAQKHTHTHTRARARISALALWNLHMPGQNPTVQGL